MRKLEDQLGITPIALIVAEMMQEFLNIQQDLQEGLAEKPSGPLGPWAPAPRHGLFASPVFL